MNFEGPFENEEPIHCRMLQTFYRKMTGSKFDCQRFGSHWEQIGFQGTKNKSFISNFLYFYCSKYEKPSLHLKKEQEGLKMTVADEKHTLYLNIF